jgi:hypothetical protein
MPKFDYFNLEIDNIYKKFINNKFNKEILENRKYKLCYHMHPNRRLKKLLFIYAFPIKKFGRESNVPFFIISVNKIKKNNKEKFICIYNNFFSGYYEVKNIIFNVKEDEKSIKKNIKTLQKIIKIIKNAFYILYKELRQNINFYKQ